MFWMSRSLPSASPLQGQGSYRASNLLIAVGVQESLPLRVGISFLINSCAVFASLPLLTLVEALLSLIYSPLNHREYPSYEKISIF